MSTQPTYHPVSLQVTHPKRIGPRMAEAVDYVRDNPGCPMLPVAAHVGPNGSLRYGYRTVKRAVRAGLIQARKRANGRWCLRVRSLEV